LNATIALALEREFRSVCVEAIAAKSNAAKTTIYRRWHNKAAIIMDASMP
jgi:AcrR family transcriptional regulator